MIQIALCDDEEKELEKTAALLEEYQRARPACGFCVWRFSSFSSMLFELPDLPPLDLLLLDSSMLGKNSVDGARKLRENGFAGHIVFLAASKEYALEAGNVNAAHYLLRPVDKTRFFAVLDKVLGTLRQERRRYLALRADRKVRRVPLRDIVYCESQNQYQALYLADGEALRTRMTGAQLYEAVCAYSDFVRVGSTYVVNLSYVDSLNAKVMKLSTGKEVWLPRGSYQALKAQYFEFYRNGGGK